MEKDSTFTFLIDHIDPLGQGVYKKDEMIFFIPKTLPGETGVAQVLKSNKVLHFCKLIKIDKKSPQRIDSECAHFDDCNGCHFLHTSRETEISFKLTTFKRMLNGFEVPSIEIIKDSDRLSYRNRIQLHYNKKYNLLGFHKYKSKSILAVPNCKILSPSLNEDFTKLQSSWKSIAKKPTGHIEIYQGSDRNNINADKAYAAGGFSQVNYAANELMLQKVKEISSQIECSNVIDLFAGKGNISDAISFKNRLCIDLYSNQPPENFHHLDLFEDGALDRFKQINTIEEVDLLIIDPPRSGFKNLHEWVKLLKPKKLLYISCHPQTMLRDLKSMNTCKIDQVYMIDLFPSTYHFEAMSLIDLSKA